ncbi:uncharacterized protein LOC142237529 [Haematobia irritans]|uniref:uncharacterized protein LOC142237529 n=1 Tax=Haematobia irritans TaxID=7368 RepID=UPI003F4FDF24
MKHILIVLAYCLVVLAYSPNHPEHFNPYLFEDESPQGLGEMAMNSHSYLDEERLKNEIFHADNLGLFDFNNIFKPMHTTDFSQGCPDSYQPVCATNGNKHLQFQTLCHFHDFNYHQLLQGRQAFVETPLSMCYNSCPTCPNVVEPICARDMENHQLIDFKSFCEMKLAGCSLQKEYRFEYPGHCFRRKPTCPRRCPKIHQPVCARYGKEFREFPNKCELQRSRCESKIDWTFNNNGACDVQSTNEYQSNTSKALSPFVLKPTSPEYEEQYF